MADSIVITETPGVVQHTWDSASANTWDGIDTLDSWSNFTAEAFDLAVGVSISITPTNPKTQGKELQDGFSVVGIETKHPQVVNLESLGVAETYIDAIGFIRNIQESLVITDTSLATWVLVFEEALSILENNPVFNTDKSIAELIHVIEVKDLLSQFQRYFEENLLTTEGYGSNTGKYLSDTIDLLDNIIRKGGAVYSEISLFNEGISLDTFKELTASGSPAGWAKFQKFLPGDYTYRYAKVRAVLETFSDDTPILDNLSVVVDVPDLHNRGTGIITNAATGIAILYDRPYSVSNPDIVIAFKGGIGGVATPEILNETLTGFTAKLINSAGTYITGSITWASDGY